MKAWLGMLASHVSSSISDKLIILAIQLITFMTIWTSVPPTGPAIFYSRAAISEHPDETLVI